MEEYPEEKHGREIEKNIIKNSFDKTRILILHLIVIDISLFFYTKVTIKTP